MSDFSRLIPKTVGILTAADEDAVYDRKTLYDYMDGGAEVYLAFDFREVWARRYAGPGGLELTLDIYDMGVPEEAFGILSCDREDPPAGIGQDSTCGYGLLRFRQGRWFVTVTAAAEDEAAEQAVLSLGREVVKRLGPPGAYPAMLDLLPRQGLRPDRTSYFHAIVNLNNRFFISSENILGLGRETDCVFAEYDTGAQGDASAVSGAAGSSEAGPDCAPGDAAGSASGGSVKGSAPGGTSGVGSPGSTAGNPAYLLIVRYPDEARAAEARRSFLAAYLPEAGDDGLAATEPGKWAMAVQRGLYVAAVFEAPSAEWAKNIAAAIPFPE